MRRWAQYSTRVPTGRAMRKAINQSGISSHSGMFASPCGAEVQRRQCAFGDVLSLESKWGAAPLSSARMCDFGEGALEGGKAAAQSSRLSQLHARGNWSVPRDERSRGDLT